MFISLQANCFPSPEQSRVWFVRTKLCTLVQQPHKNFTFKNLCYHNTPSICYQARQGHSRIQKKSIHVRSTSYSASYKTWLYSTETGYLNTTHYQAKQMHSQIQKSIHVRSTFSHNYAKTWLVLQKHQHADRPGHYCISSKATATWSLLHIFKGNCCFRVNIERSFIYILPELEVYCTAKDRL